MARKDRDMPSAPSAAIVDEQTKRAAMRTPAPKRTASPASARRFEETGAGFPDPVVEEVAEWVKAGTVQTADGPVDVNANGFAADGSKPVAKVKSKLVSTYTDEATGDIIDVYEDGTEEVRKKGTVKIDAAAAAEAAAAKRLAEKTSAFDILRREFKANGLEGLVDAAQNAIMNEETDAGRILALRNSDAYKVRFSANEQRKLKGLAVLDEASYLAKEDAYQNLMREYGLPDTYYTKDATGKQPGFDQLIANDVSAAELENRLITAQERVIRGAPQISQLLKEFYPEITNGDILAYALDPKNALKSIQSKVTAAEIGAAQKGAGLQATKAGAENLELNKVTGEQYQAAAPTISEASIRGGQLASIYKEDPYTQQTAEAAVLNVPGSAEAIRKTKKLTALEQAAFSGQSGRGVLARERAGSI
jgi:Arc/MetJ family transcription regulator